MSVLPRYRVLLEAPTAGPTAGTSLLVIRRPDPSKTRPQALGLLVEVVGLTAKRRLPNPTMVVLMDPTILRLRTLPLDLALPTGLLEEAVVISPLLGRL